MLDLSEDSVARLLARDAAQLAERARGECSASTATCNRAQHVQPEFDRRDRCHRVHAKACAQDKAK